MQHSAKEVATRLPFQGMLEIDEDDRGKLFDHFKVFFSSREKRQVELLKVESKVDRQRRESREKNPPLKKTKMFEWTRVMTSDGQTLHMRVLVPQCKHQYFHSELDGDRRIYNAMANEWDIFSEFSLATADAPIKTDYQALFADPGSPDYHMDDYDEITAADGWDPPPHADGQQDQPAAAGGDVPTYDDGGQPVIITDSVMESMPSSVISDAVNMHTHTDGQKDPPAADGEDIPTYDDSWQPVIITDSPVEFMPSDVISDAVADGQDTDGQASGGQDFPTHDDSRQPEIVTDSCMESMSFTAPDAGEEESDLFQQLQLTYGCANPLGLALDATAYLDWRGVLMALGLVKDRGLYHPPGIPGGFLRIPHHS